MIQIKKPDRVRANVVTAERLAGQWVAIIHRWRSLMHTKITFASLVSLALLAAVSAASSAMAADSGFYVGGGIGQATLKDDASNIDIDENDTAWKAYAGYRFGGLIPLLDLAGELTYRDFGKPEGTNFEYDATGYDASALGILTLGPIDLFLRVGVGQYDIESVVNGLSSDDDGTAGMYGVGAGLRVWRVNIRAEWERIEPDGVDNIDMYSINAYFRF